MDAAAGRRDLAKADRYTISSFLTFTDGSQYLH